jgi:hypothetical protein
MPGNHQLNAPPRAPEETGYRRACRTSVHVFTTPAYGQKIHLFRHGTYRRRMNREADEFRTLLTRLSRALSMVEQGRSDAKTALASCTPLDSDSAELALIG